MAYGQPRPYNSPEDKKEDIEFGKKLCCLGIVAAIIISLFLSTLQ